MGLQGSPHGAMRGLLKVMMIAMVRRKLIAYGVVPSNLGHVLVAQSDEGVVAILTTAKQVGDDFKETLSERGGQVRPRDYTPVFPKDAVRSSIVRGQGGRASDS